MFAGSAASTVVSAGNSRRETRAVLAWLAGGRKLALQDPVQPVGLPRQVDVVSDVRLFANQFVWFDDKAADVPDNYLKSDITERGGKDRRDQPAPALHRCGIHR